MEVTYLLTFVELSISTIRILNFPKSVIHQPIFYSLTQLPSFIIYPILLTPVSIQFGTQLPTQITIYSIRHSTSFHSLSLLTKTIFYRHFTQNIIFHGIYGGRDDPFFVHLVSLRSAYSISPTHSVIYSIC